MVKDYISWIRQGQERSLRSLARVVEQDRVVAQRGEPSLPKLRFMEGKGPEDPKYDARTR